MRRLKNNRKGAYFFLIDVFLGIFIFAVSVLVMTSFNVFTPTSNDVEQRIAMLSADLFNAELRDISNPYLLKLKTSNPYYEPLLTVDQYAAILHNHSETENATKLIRNLTQWLPSTLGFNYTIQGEEIYSREAQTITKDLSTAGLTKQKITMVQSNITTSYDPVITRIEVWQ